MRVQILLFTSRPDCRLVSGMFVRLARLASKKIPVKMLVSFQLVRTEHNLEQAGQSL